MTSYLTAEHMLNRAVVTADETVLVSGVSGGVGSARVQLALLRGAKVVAVVGKYKEEPLKALGVHGIIFRDEKDYQGTVMGTRQESKRIVDLVASGMLKPLLARVYPLSKLVQAQKDFKKKAHFGKLVVVP